MGEEELRKLVGSHGFSVANLSPRLIDDGRLFEYRMVIRSRDRGQRPVALPAPAQPARSDRVPHLADRGLGVQTLRV